MESNTNLNTNIWTNIFQYKYEYEYWSHTVLITLKGLNDQKKLPKKMSNVQPHSVKKVQPKQNCSETRILIGLK